MQLCGKFLTPEIAGSVSNVNCRVEHMFYECAVELIELWGWSRGANFNLSSCFSTD
jgi:hypothetical protein